MKVQSAIINGEEHEFGQGYTAGTNISINNNEISAIDTTYIAGEGIEIGTAQDYSAMRGPCPEGFHIPKSSELSDFYNKVSAFGLTLEDVGFPTYGFLQDNTGNLNLNYDGAEYRSCDSERKPEGYEHTEYLAYSLSKTSVGFEGKGYGHYIRPFRDKPIIPDNSWTIIYDGSSIASGAGIFHNPTLGVISYSSDGTTWKTIADKNLGAENVYVNGDGYSQVNCGGFFQRGNCYMFPYTGAVDKSSTLVEVSGYGPGNYYSSSTFVKAPSSGQSRDRASDTGVGTEDLWGGVTGVVTIDNVISNTGVLSVNGQTGHVTVESGGKQSYFKTQDEYDVLPASKESDGNLYIIVDNHTQIYTWEELENMGSQNALQILNEHPEDYAEYYASTGDLIKYDYYEWFNDEHGPLNPLPEGKYVFRYNGQYNDCTISVFITNLTESEISNVGFPSGYHFDEVWELVCGGSAY